MIPVEQADEVATVRQVFDGAGRLGEALTREAPVIENRERERGCRLPGVELTDRWRISQLSIRLYRCEQARCQDVSPHSRALGIALQRIRGPRSFPGRARRSLRRSRFGNDQHELAISR